jgi:type I restriction enzyme, S subunit
MNAEIYELPEGWTWAQFQDVAEVVSDLVDPADYRASPHIAPNHIESFTGRLLPYSTIARDGVKSPKHRFRPGQILYSKIRPYLCKAVLVDFCGLCSADMYPVSSKIDTAYLHGWLISPRFTEWTSNHDARTLLPKINQEALSTIPIPVPPLAEQQRIAAKVEALLVRVNEARQRLAKAPAILKRFRQSVLAAACSGRLTADWRKDAQTETAHDLLESIRKAKERLASMTFRKSFPDGNGEETEEEEIPESWIRVKLFEICSHIADIDHKMPKAVERGVKFLSAKDLLDDGTLNLTDNVKLISEADYERLSRKIVPERNDIIYSRIGACLGKARLVESDERFLVSYSCCVIRALVLNPAYLCRFLDSGAVLRKARTEAKSIGVPDLGLSEISQFRVPLPPLAEQHEIVRRVEALLRLADTIEKRVAAATTRAEKLTQAILAKAFRGELVPTEAELARREGRSYEPASALLERIQARLQARNSTTQRRATRSRKRTT